MAARRYDETKRQRAPGAGRPRKRPRTSDRPVIEEVVGAASRLFARRGVAVTTMAEIADASGLQVSSIYYYFRSKHEILERIVNDVNRVPLELLEQARASHTDPATRLHAFVRADAAALCEFPFDINEIHRLAGDDDGTFTRYWADRQRLNDEVEQLVADGVADGSMVTIDPKLAALTILANDEAAQNWHRPVGARRLASRDPSAGGPYTPAEIGAFLADLALRGLLTDPTALPAIRAATDPT
ncbi:MAG: TetR/AcrR family transcriptional regulator [Actinomycetota bacterium]|nr:TetR/AcrR family transcriptional regulator [Actinomycetota bacterium]